MANTTVKASWIHVVPIKTDYLEKQEDRKAINVKTPLDSSFISNMQTPLENIFTATDVQKALENKTGTVLVEGIYPNGMIASYGFGL